MFTVMSGLVSVPAPFVARIENVYVPAVVGLPARVPSAARINPGRQRGTGKRVTRRRLTVGDKGVRVRRPDGPIWCRHVGESGWRGPPSVHHRDCSIKNVGAAWSALLDEKSLVHCHGSTRQHPLTRTIALTIHAASAGRSPSTGSMRPASSSLTTPLSRGCRTNQRRRRLFVPLT